METPLELFLNKCRKDRLHAFVESNPHSFAEAIELILNNKKEVAWRAAWFLENCMCPDDPRIAKHVRRFVEILPEREESEQRELMRILYQMNVPEDIEGLLFDQCILIWTSTHKKSAVRINALKLICKIVKKQPELIGELKMLTQGMYLSKISLPLQNSIKRLLQSTIKS
jgi:hypothetical protein